MKECFYKVLSVIKRFKPNTKFIITGDFRQYSPVNDRIIDCNYKDSLILKELTDNNRIILTKCRRTEEEELFNICKDENILNVKSHNFPHELSKINICFTNKKRKEINKILMEEEKNKLINELKKKHLKTKGFQGLIINVDKADEYGQDVELFKGMPILAIKNHSKLDIVNNEMFKIFNIKGDVITLVNDNKEIEFESKDFNYNFVVAYAITSHCAQGETFNEKFTIHEWNRLNKTGKYVSLSRSSKLEYINIINY
jgi:ATP-dependent exoDNAse (exonuclease V) alpha subunit